jgi:ankyrin repeat protein
MNHMIQAFEDVHIEEPLRSALLSFFKRSSAYVINLDEDESIGHPEIARRWDVQHALDQAVAAIRAGDADRAIALAGNSTLQICDRTLFTGLLARMIRSRQPALLDYVREQLTRDPSLVHQRYAGRTLLHEAAAAGSSAAVELLLSSGADPNATDGGGHAPLYSLGNGCVTAGGEVVRSLVRAGANVNANSGVKNCTALHMAARRDNVDVARALLECGADIEARDSLGETPLRRAVNCNQVGVAALLISKGADVHSPGSKGRTPKLAARSSAMKRLFETAPIR